MGWRGHLREFGAAVRDRTPHHATPSARVSAMTMYQRTTSELNSPATTLYGEFAKPYLAKLLNLLSIDRVYTRAQGDYLTDASGNDVLDLLGGYGSTLLGHNHPRLVKALCDAYAAN